MTANESAPWTERVQRNLIVRTFQQFSEDDCMTMAAALAYYAVFSLPPLLLLALHGATWVWGSDVDAQMQIESEVERVAGDTIADQVHMVLDQANRSGQGTGATLLGIGVLLFTASGIMAQLQASLNKTWQVEAAAQQGGVQQFIIRRALALAMVLIAGGLLLASIVLTSVSTWLLNYGRELLPGFWNQWLVFGVDLGLSLLVITVLFATIFKWLPNIQLHWRNVLVGAFVTALLFQVGKFALAWHLGRMDSAYGAASGLVLFLVWVYYSSLIFFWGAEFTQVWSGRTRRPQGEPASSD